MKRLDGAERQRLRKILLGLLSVRQLDMLLADYLDINRETISLGGDSEEVFFDVITEADKGLWLAELVEAARKLRPRDPELYGFAVSAFGLGIRGMPARDVLERAVVPEHKQLAFGKFNAAAAAVERQVARIAYPVAGGTCYGTGFLVGPSLLLTNHHVIEPILNGKSKAENVTVQFDYKEVGDKVQNGRLVRLSAEWLLDSSEPAPGDLVVSPAALPTEEQLDYALLQLAEAAGDEPVGPTSDPKAQTRGWIDLAKVAASDPLPGSAVLIVQHPKGNPLSLAMELDGIVGVNENSTRIRYRTNTEHGSSGSPVFDIDWNLIALHHIGDPDYSPGHKPEFNQGVVIRQIVGRLRKRGKL